MKNPIDHFISLFNKFMNTGRSGSPDWEIRKKEGVQHPRDTVLYLLEGFDYSSAQGGWFNLHFQSSDLDIPSRFIPFAGNGNYNLFYVFDSVSKEVFCWDPESEELDWPCGKTLESFFSAMSLILEGVIRRNQNPNWQPEDSYYQEIFEQCIALNGGDKKYAEFYEHLLGI